MDENKSFTNFTDGRKGLSSAMIDESAFDQAYSNVYPCSAGA